MANTPKEHNSSCTDVSSVGGEIDDLVSKPSKYDAEKFQMAGAPSSECCDYNGRARHHCRYHGKVLVLRMRATSTHDKALPPFTYGCDCTTT